MHPADFIHPNLDHDRINLAAERLQNLARPSLLGFLDPFLYSKGVAGLVDIVVRVSSPV